MNLSETAPAPLDARKREIQAKYDAFARWYDPIESVPEWLRVGRLRRTLLSRASGNVLDVAAGTGRNLPYYPKTCTITAVDLSPVMLDVAGRRAARLGLRATFRVMDAEALAFHDGSFDTVASTLSGCTFPDPVRALREMARVCRQDGRILLIEHGRSDREWLGRWQDRRAARHARRLGCHWNREPERLVQEAGLRVVSARRMLFGVFHRLELAPGPRSGGGDEPRSA